MTAGDGRRRTGTDMPSEDEGFLGRWSRRKAAAKSDEAAALAEPDVIDEASDDGRALSPADAADPPEFDVSSLPDIDSLGPKSDFSMFMQAGVPPELKTKALRKLWRVKSELANLDGLIDYGEDLTGSFKVVDHLKTAYEVGRGFLRDDKEAEKKGDDAAADETALVAADDPALDETAPGENMDSVESPGPDDQNVEKQDG